jgi:hypothetical protein
LFFLYLRLDLRLDLRLRVRLELDDFRFPPDIRCLFDGFDIFDGVFDSLLL